MPSPSKLRRATARALAACTSHTEWKQVALEADREQNLDAWRDDPESPLYDARRVTERLRALVRARATAAAEDAMALLHEALASDWAGVTAPALYATALSGPKRIVTAFVDELVATIEWLGAPAFSGANLRGLAKEAKAFGASALMLSGGAGFGLYHLGVVRALLEAGLLPTVISGSSTGAMIAAWICCHDDATVRAGLERPATLRFDGLRLSGVGSAFSRGALLDPEHMYDAFKETIGAFTFEEAARRSGRMLNISVSPTDHLQRPRVLSSITSPSVLVPKAVLASCALPGMFPAATLTQRDRSGVEAPYGANERWIDGSFHGDVPMRSVGRLHNVTNFVVSQTNPYVTSFPGKKGGLADLTASIVRSQGAHVASVVGKLTSRSTVGRNAHRIATLLSQEYSGDIDIRPAIDLGMVPRVFANPRPVDLARFVLGGMRATWPVLERVRDQLRVRRALEQCANGAGLA